MRTIPTSAAQKCSRLPPRLLVRSEGEPALPRRAPRRPCTRTRPPRPSAAPAKQQVARPPRIDRICAADDGYRPLRARSCHRRPDPSALAADPRKKQSDCQHQARAQPIARRQSTGSGIACAARSTPIDSLPQCAPSWAAARRQPGIQSDPARSVNVRGPRARRRERYQLRPPRA
jgi:hypothetical protein